MTYTGIPFPDISPVALQIGSFGLRWYSLAYLAGLFFGWLLLQRMLSRYKTAFTPEMVDDTLFYAAVGIIVGGRLGYVLFYNFDHYYEYPLRVFALWEGGMSFHGGLIGTIIALYVYARRVRVPFLAITDAMACVAPLGLFFGRLANFVNGELYGRVTTSVPWAVIFPAGGPFPRHPSQLYEACFEGFVLFVCLYVLWTRSVWVRIRVGFTSGLFLTGYAVARMMVENFREPDAQIGFLFARVTMGQTLTLPMLLCGLFLMLWSARRTSGAQPQQPRKKGWWQKTLSLLKLRIVIPMLREKQPPEYTAKGAMVGMAWAMTPLVGIQMYLVFMTWIIARKAFKWHFSLPVALAWTWVTNVFTMLPIYYLFYVTGKLMTGSFSTRTTYGAFVGLWREAFKEAGVIEALKVTFDIMIKDWGAAMMLGGLPWAVVGGWAAYAWTASFLRRRQKKKQKKLEKATVKEQEGITQ